ncbi:MAG: 23S rRNA (guanosine(2251)-2'-O)-methyltransferase RlmB [Bacteroidales bacterium]|nr:23S rRNA (guanosine(2251)-2'-O)-methyltransferase RlmB [Bacteroidales bacterium]MBO7320361.1 23S rRNA (guanosine(2251)-2'-O)-methyltransferase RlmB [Bacteroidales bacterium]MBO7764563.1 23S rRNA (guanosine(2251)-2'-O)-methyltransferase RlmB [Bacteroidales bacterium]
MEDKLNYLFGMHPVMEAVRAGKNIDKVMLKQGLDSPQFRDLMELLKEKGVQAQFVPAERLNKICKGNHQGVIALFSKIDYTPFEEMVDIALMQNSAPVFIMLDGVSDVRNLGAIARTAECAGASGIIVPAKGGAAITSEGIKASAGALLRINVAKTQNLRLPAMYLKEQGFQIVGATEKSDKDIYGVDFTKPTAIVMGSEGKGISDSMLALCDDKAKIPMAGEISSLNVSVATAVCLYEAVRQRGGKL